MDNSVGKTIFNVPLSMLNATVYAVEVRDNMTMIM